MLRIEPSPSQTCTAHTLPLSPVTGSRDPPGLISQPLPSKVEMVASPQSTDCPLTSGRLSPGPL